MKIESAGSGVDGPLVGEFSRYVGLNGCSVLEIEDGVLSVRNVCAGGLETLRDGQDAGVGDVSGCAQLADGRFPVVVERPELGDVLHGEGAPREVDELPADMEFVGAEAARGGVAAVVEEPGRLNGIRGDASMVAERLDGEGVETLGVRLRDRAGVGYVEVVEFKSTGG